MRPARFPRPLAGTVALFMLLGGATCPARADPITLADLLLPNATLVDDGLIFFHFVWDGSTAIPGTGGVAVPLDPDEVDILGGTDRLGNPAIRFVINADAQILGGPGDDPSAASMRQAAFSYKVTTVSGLPLIVTNTLALTGQAVAGPSGTPPFNPSSASVGERAVEGSPVPGGQVGSPNVFLMDPGPDQPFSLASFAPPVTQLDITTSIDQTAGSGGGISSVSDITQGFAQAAVPEPASIVLLGVGLLGLLWWLAGARRRALRRSQGRRPSRTSPHRMEPMGFNRREQGQFCWRP
jgi:PEP-CTERM motif